MNWKLILTFMAGLLALASGAEPEERRQQAKEWQTEGNWKDALEGYRELLEEVNDEKTGEDLSAALRSI